MSGDIRSGMPVLVRHEGEWWGEYVHIDTDGAVLDRHASRLVCAFPDSGPFDYHQTNAYTWNDGKREELRPGRWTSARSC